MKTAIAAFEEEISENSDSQNSMGREGLTEEQNRRREFYLCFQRNEKTSDHSIILANVGLACLAIRRFLQVNLFSPSKLSPISCKLQGDLDNPSTLTAAEKEFGDNLTIPCRGWQSLSKPFEFAIAVGPLILFRTRKLSAGSIARSKLTTVS
jgi:hypothetical protein